MQQEIPEIQAESELKMFSKVLADADFVSPTIYMRRLSGTELVNWRHKASHSPVNFGIELRTG